MIQAIRGMNDILPEKIAYWEFLEATCRSVASAYGYREIRTPLVESTDLFKRSIGEATDIVEKEMYTFADRNGDSLTLRPEGTASCVRAGIEHGLLYNQVQRLWYLGPMFRHERPQKGRYRQFYQFGVEALGMASYKVDAEVILLSQRLLHALGLAGKVSLELNTLGNADSRARYRKSLVDYFESHKSTLDDDSQRRLYANPLRILDSKNPKMQELIEAAPKLIDYLDDESKTLFAKVCETLDQLKVPYTINPRLVRGLDYYCHTVYEWVTTELGAQGTVLAGGRYDKLVELLGGKMTPAVGFACGLERLVLLLEQFKTCHNNPDIYFVMEDEAAGLSALALAEALRDEIPSLKVELNLSGGSFKSQFKRADKSGAKFAVVLGADEIANNKATLKYLREKAPQKQFDRNELITFLRTQKE